MNAKVFITGNSGLIGRWCVKRLRTEGFRTVGFDVQRAPQGEWHPDEHILGDILDRDEISHAVSHARPDFLIHLAARTDLLEEKDIAGYSANTQGVRNVISAVRATDSISRAVYTSSQLVCRIGYQPKHDEDYCPHTLYGQSKVVTERIVREEDGGGTTWCLVRPTTVWGPHMSSHYQNMLRLIRSGRFFHCGEKKLYKSYGYAGNIAFQYLRLLLAPPENIHMKTFYLADYVPLSLREYAVGLQEAMGAPPIPTVPIWCARALAMAGDIIHFVGWRSFPFNSFRLRNILTEYVFDLRELEHVCGPLPYTAQEGITATAKWFLEQ